MAGSPIFAHAVEEWRRLRDEHALLIEHQYAAAEAATRGNLLNKRGRENKIDPFTLFYGTEARAMAYASEELIEYWAAHPRVPFSAYEAAAVTGHVCESCGQDIA